MLHLGPFRKPRREIEVLPTPPELVPAVWKQAQKWLRKIPNFDLDRARVRLLSGEDTLWLATLTQGKHERAHGPYAAALITTVSDKQPFKWKAPKLFVRKDPALRRSLVLHLANGFLLDDWIDQAVERIAAYGKQQKCRQLYVLARKGWRRYATRFYSPDWDIVGYSRDRPTPYKKAHYPGWNMVGRYRVMKPLNRPMRLQDWMSGTMCYFREHRR